MKLPLDSFYLKLQLEPMALIRATDLLNVYSVLGTELDGRDLKLNKKEDRRQTLSLPP